MAERSAVCLVVVSFAMLWVPLGQHAFLNEHWMKVGTFMAPFLAFVAVTFGSDRMITSEPRFLSLLLLLAYIVHQFEEHWVDIYGRTYAFQPYLNDFLSGLTGSAPGTEFMSTGSIFVINTSLVWLVGALAILRGAKHIFATLCMTSIVVVNAISHIGAGLNSGAYNPGLVTSALIFLPLGVTVYRLMLRSGAATMRLVMFSLIWGLLAHVIMISGILIMNAAEQIPETFYFAALIGWSLLPSILFPTNRTEQAQPLRSAA